MGARVVLLGGAAGTGKSVSGTEAARRLGMQCVSADSIWATLKAATSAETQPALHHFEPLDEVLARGPAHLCRLHIETSEAMTGALEAFIDGELREGHSLLLEGAWITPEMAARRMRSGAAAVFVHEPDAREALRALMGRRGMDRATERQRVLAEMGWLYGNWLRDGAERCGLAVVPARPRETLVERILDEIRDALRRSA